MFTKDEIRAANMTSRTNGASAKNKDGSVRAVVPKYVAQYINKEEKCNANCGGNGDRDIKENNGGGVFLEIPDPVHGKEQGKRA